MGALEARVSFNGNFTESQLTLLGLTDYVTLLHSTGSGSGPQPLGSRKSGRIKTKVYSFQTSNLCGHPKSRALLTGGMLLPEALASFGSKRIQVFCVGLQGLNSLPRYAL